MKRIFFLMIITIFMISILCGCSNKSNIDTQESQDMSQWSPQYTDEWQDNEYTQNISKPKTGEMDYYIDDSENRRFSIALKGMTMENTNDYIEQLKSDGYEELAGDENDASGGALLQKDNVSVSIAYAESGCIISIVIE